MEGFIMKEEYLKREFSNPFNWTGSKHRYLKDLFTILPVHKKGLKVLDPFCGGGDLISKLPDDWEIIAGDVSEKVIGLHKACKEGTITVDSVKKEFNRRGMSKTNKEAYLSLREEYNSNPNPFLLYLLMTNSFNNQLRFSSKGFNMSFGKDRSSFNPTMQIKLDNYCKSLKTSNISFKSCPYQDYDFSKFDLLLIDPPYSNTCATYNESTGWGYEDDIELFNKIEDSGKDFIYFNQTWSKGKNNPILLEWIKKYDYKVLKETSTNCSYHRNNDFTQEVMVYKIS